MQTRFCLLIAAGLLIPAGAFAQSSTTMSDSDCAALFSRADKDKDGSLSTTELTPFQTAMQTGTGTSTGSTTGTTSGSTTGSTTGTTTGTTSGSATAALTGPLARDQFMTNCKANDFSTVQIP